MLTKKERMEKLNQAGVNTNKYFNIDLPNGLAPGSKISIVINDNGEPEIVRDNMQIAEQIIEDGYVRNTKLHRRFVMAQMFRFLNYKSYDGTRSGFDACLKDRYDYQYTFKMMLEEVNVLGKLERSDKESFDERSHFFTKEVIAATMDDYVEQLKKYIGSLPTRRCKGIPYKRIKGRDIFVADFDKKIYHPLRHEIYGVTYAKNYSEIYRHLKDFMHDMIHLPWNTPKSKAWIDAYKGEGAYYTCKNLIMYHKCKVVNQYGEALSRDTSMDVLKEKLDEYQYEGWRMFAFMKKLIEDNHFDFGAKMREIYGN